MRINNKSFTLIELLIVILIVAILASVAVPMMRSSIKKAIAAEGVAALGTIRSAERLYYLEMDKHIEGLENILELPGINPGDLNGTYFSESCYYIDLTFNPPGIFCNPQQSQAPKSDQVTGWQGVIIMDYNGEIYSDMPDLGYKEFPQ